MQQKERIEDKLVWAPGAAAPGNKVDQLRERKKEVMKKLHREKDNFNNRSKKIKTLKKQLVVMNKNFIAAAKARHGHDDDDTTSSESDSD